MQKPPPKVLCKKGVLRNFAKFTGPSTLLKKRLWHRCFPVSFTKFLRNLFYRTLLLQMDFKFCNRENTKYSCISCGNRVCNACEIPVDELQKRL